LAPAVRMLSHDFRPCIWPVRTPNRGSSHPRFVGQRVAEVPQEHRRGHLNTLPDRDEPVLCAWVSFVDRFRLIVKTACGRPRANVGLRGSMRGAAGRVLSAGTMVLVLAGCWPGYRFGPRHTGYNPFETHIGASNVGTLKQAWVGAIGSSVSSSP